MIELPSEDWSLHVSLGLPRHRFTAPDATSTSHYCKADRFEKYYMIVEYHHAKSRLCQEKLLTDRGRMSQPQNQHPNTLLCLHCPKYCLKACKGGALSTPRTVEMRSVKGKAR